LPDVYMANPDLAYLEEERIKLRYLLLDAELAPEVRSAIKAHLERIEKMIAEAKRSD
jgi:hypothetical protein